MKLSIILVALILTAACATGQHPFNPSTAVTPQLATATDNAQSVAAPADAPDPEQSKLLRLQDRLNILASPKFVSDVQAAKAAGADSIQVGCMDPLVEIGADIKARPLITIVTTDLSAVDQSCGWCVIAAKRKADAARAGGPSILAQVAEGRKRLAALARKGLVACAPLREDMRLSLLNPENAAGDLLGLINLLGGGGN